MVSVVFLYSIVYGSSVVAEVTDQNFADEENGEKASNACSSKKMKTVETNDSSNDQVIC